MEFPPFELIDESGLYHAARMWERYRALSSGVADDTAEEEWHLDRLVLDLLGVGIDRGVKMSCGGLPDKAAFYRWAEEENGGPLSEERRREANRWLEMGRKGEWGPLFSGNAVLSGEEMAFFRENGYLVVKGAITREEAEASADAVRSFFHASAEDPESWYRPHEAWKKVMVGLFRHPALDATRNAPKVVGSFAQLWNREILATAVNQVGFNPPETERYRFPGPEIHWDTSLEPPVPLYLDGVLYLTDTEEEQGAFACVPGFHKEVDRWVEGLPEGSDPRSVDWGHRLKPIAGKAGDLVIFHHALPHGPTPNRGKSPRIVQYVNCYPPAFKDLRPWR